MLFKYMAKKLAILFGLVFILVGLLAFIPNPIVGAGSGAIFLTDRMHDAVHLISGVIFLVVGLKKPESAAKTLMVLGVVYLLVTVLGFVHKPEGGEVAGLIAMNKADHILHLVLGVVLVLLGLFARKKDVSVPVSSPSEML
jgi:hypothetical protein